MTTATTAPAPAPETTQTVLEFGHAVLGVLYDFTHLPDVTAVYVAHPRVAVVTVGEPYTFTGAHNLALWAIELNEPIRFQPSPLPQLTVHATLADLRFEFTAGMTAAMVDEFERRSHVMMTRKRMFAPLQVLAAFADHPALDVAQ